MQTEEIKTTFDIYNNKEYNFPNDSKVVFFNWKWIIINPKGVVFPDKYDLKEDAINRVIKVYNL